MPPTPDLSFTGLDEFVNEPIVENYKAMSSGEEPKVIRKNDDAPIIKEWVSDDEKEDVSQPKTEKKIVRPSIVKKEFSFTRSLLTNYEEIDEGYVAFGGNPKGGKITRKCTIKAARTPQQNGVAERRNMTLIEVAKTMLADSKCNNTLLGRNHLGKFNGKADEGFFVGYSLNCKAFRVFNSRTGIVEMNSKAFRVFNSRTRIVEENLHIKFSENTPNAVGTKASDNAGQAIMETEPVKDYILLPLWTTDLPFSQGPKSSQDDGSKPSSDDGKKVDEVSRKDSECNDQEKEDNVNSTNNVNVASINDVNDVSAKTSIKLPVDPDMPAFEDINMFDLSNDDEDDGGEADMNNLDTTIQVSPNPTIRIHKDHPLDQVIRDLQSATQTRRMSKNLEEHGFVSTIKQRTNHKDLQNGLFACFLSQEEPKKVIHALKDLSWIEAMQEELLQFKLQEV
ncbi:putative ribonuclease H-like domain-containing protein [Tanacetum coccineum]